jgi:hypothetical protein
VNNVLDHLTNWLWVAFMVTFGWAWQIDRRVAKLETLREATDRKIDDLRDEIKDSNAKLDRLIDKLL